jgi:ATP-dependent helicase/nuclease subunit B
MVARPNVFTIPASVPFLPALLRALRDGTLVPGFPAARNPLALASATLYLPTRRACRLARDLFLDVFHDRAAILPRIVAIGDIDEDEIAFAQVAGGTLAAPALELPAALGGLERRMLLAQLVLKWAGSIAPDKAGDAPLVANNPVSALALADDLAHLMDDMTTRGVAWERLDQLVPETLDRYWQLTLEFLKIARDAWPKILAERGAIEPAARRDALIKAEAARLATHRDGPVIAAGSTGSMPATAELIATIAKLPHGAVVLPGLDLALDAESWQSIAGDEPAEPALGHPQFAMQALLRRIGIAREEVAVLGDAAFGERARQVSEALRPAATTDRWQKLTSAGSSAQAALAGLSVIEAANAEEEALAIAIALREAVETAGKTAALVTPDRDLARRVLAALERWQIAADDSGGDLLADTSAGRFARLAAQAALNGVTPVAVLALLKHPLTRLGAAQGAHGRAIAALERAILRGPRPQPGTSRLANALAAFRAELAKLWRKEPCDLHPSDPRADLRDAELAAAAALVEQLGHALAPLERLSRASRSFAEFAAHLCDVVTHLSRDDAAVSAAFTERDGIALAEAFDEIAQTAGVAALAVVPEEFADLFKAAIADRVVRRPGRPGVRVHIYGLLEARLQSADRIVLGGLVEGVWPPQTRSDPWLSRPMRQALGLDLPERRSSLSAHDFAQALGASEVVLAYPTKLAGTPTVPSRFVQRLEAVAGEARWQEARASGAKYLGWARALDRPPEVKRIERPAPKPPRAARPTGLSVTDVENWLRDPYTIYAKHILKLRELEPVDLPPGAADRGIVIHAALGEFTKSYAGALPADPAAELIKIGAKHFAALEDYPEARAFWWPRFQRIARWFAAWDRERRSDGTEFAAEAAGQIPISLRERVFTLRARADRIERRADGRYAILDYKTGQVPSEKQVRIGISPQLTLEAAILRHGGFPGIGAGAAISDLVYVSLRGGELAGEEKPIEFKQGDANLHAERALEKFIEVAKKFEDEQQPYLPLVLSMWKSRYGPYDHLARVKEWSAGGAEDAAEGE